MGIIEEFDKLVEEACAGEFGSLSHNKAMAKLQAFSVKVLSLDLKNLGLGIIDLPKKLNAMVDRIVESNEKLAKAHKKYLFWQNVLTAVLASATIGLVIATLVLAFR